MAMTLRLPEDLQAEAAELAQYLGCSLNAVVIQALRGFVIFHNKQRPHPDLAGLQAMTAQAATKGLVSRATEKARTARTAARPIPALGKSMTAPSTGARVGANQPCPCGSGQKYKRCHGKR